MLFYVRIHSEVTNWLSRDYTQRNELDINSSSLSLIPLFSATMNSIKHVNFVNDIRSFILKQFTIQRKTQIALQQLHIPCSARSNREITQNIIHKNVLKYFRFFRARRIHASPIASTIPKFSKSGKPYNCDQKITAKLKR